MALFKDTVLNDGTVDITYAAVNKRNNVNAYESSHATGVQSLASILSITHSTTSNGQRRKQANFTDRVVRDLNGVSTSVDSSNLRIDFKPSRLATTEEKRALWLKARAFFSDVEIEAAFVQGEGLN